MASSIALPRPQPLAAPKQFLELLPGIGLLVAIGYGGKFLERAINLYAKAQAQFQCSVTQQQGSGSGSGAGAHRLQVKPGSSYRFK